MPADRIRIEMPAQHRFQPVVRAAILHAARHSGLGPGEASRFASAVTEKWRTLARQRDGGRTVRVSLSIDLGAAELAVLIDPGRGRTTTALRTNVILPRDR